MTAFCVCCSFVFLDTLSFWRFAGPTESRLSFFFSSSFWSARRDRIQEHTFLVAIGAIPLKIVIWSKKLSL